MKNEINIDNYAVLEHCDIYGEWQILAHIGELWSGGNIDEYDEGSTTYKSVDLRIRYLNRNEGVIK